VLLERDLVLEVVGTNAVKVSVLSGGDWRPGRSAAWLEGQTDRECDDREKVKDSLRYGSFSACQGADTSLARTAAAWYLATHAARHRSPAGECQVVHAAAGPEITPPESINGSPAAGHR
jgi:hypothetical protein